jgi:hypothetical protein
MDIRHSAGGSMVDPGGTRTVQCDNPATAVVFQSLITLWRYSESRSDVNILVRAVVGNLVHWQPYIV